MSKYAKDQCVCEPVRECVHFLVCPKVREIKWWQLRLFTCCVIKAACNNTVCLAVLQFFSIYRVYSRLSTVVKLLVCVCIYIYLKLCVCVLSLICSSCLHKWTHSWASLWFRQDSKNLCVRACSYIYTCLVCACYFLLPSRHLFALSAVWLSWFYFLAASRCVCFVLYDNMVF